MADVAPGLESTPSQRWLARLSFVFAGAAIVILDRGSLGVVGVTVGSARQAPKPPVNWSRLRHLAGAPHPGQPI